MANKYAIETDRLTKTYRNTNVVDGLSMQVKEGEIYGFIGKNGAGKTTVLRMVTGLVAPTSGSYKLYGAEDAAGKADALKSIGSIIETPALYPRMTAFQNLEIRRLASGIGEKSLTAELLERVGLDPTDKKRAADFSLGMKQRLGLAAALIGDPKMLILDEPFNGLDPSGIAEIREIIRDLNKRGATVLISSHILGELAKLADCFGVIREGKLVEQITKKQLLQKSCGAIRIVCADTFKAVKIFEDKLNTKNYKLKNGALYLYDFVDNPSVVNKALVEGDVIVNEFAVGGDDLEGYFISLMEGKK